MLARRSVWALFNLWISSKRTCAATVAGPRLPMDRVPIPPTSKFFPKTSPATKVVKIMHKYEADLGVECEYCHARNPETKRNDFPSDANPVKDKARMMIKMTDEINTRYLTQLPDHKSTDPVTCGTCHRGMAHPEAFVPKPPGTITAPAPPHHLRPR